MSIQKAPARPRSAIRRLNIDGMSIISSLLPRRRRTVASAPLPLRRGAESQA